MAVRAHRKGLELICDVQSDVPDALVGDAGRLRQVLLNLVGNAIKFTEAGEVVVRVEVAQEGGPGGEVGLRFCVRDTGIGIPPDKCEKIFRAFEQEDTSTTRKYGGHRPGPDHRGTSRGADGRARSAWRASRQGEQLRLYGAPRSPGAGCRSAPGVVAGLAPQHAVLVVDDNITNRRLLEEWLRRWRMTPTGVGDGSAAMQAIERAAASGRRTRWCSWTPVCPTWTGWRSRRRSGNRPISRARASSCSPRRSSGGPHEIPGTTAECPPAQAGPAG